MTELKVNVTKKLVKRAAAVAMAVCMAATVIPTDVFAFTTTKSDYDSSKDYYNAGVYDPSTGAGGYYDPENKDGYYNPDKSDADKPGEDKPGEIIPGEDKPGEITPGEDDPSTDHKDYYDPANTDGYYGPDSKDGYYDPSTKDGYYAPTAIKINPITQKSILEGDKVQLTAQVVAPEGSKVEVTLNWSSDDETVAAVEANEKGALVTAKKAGKAVITANAKEFGFEDTIDVTVEKVETKPEPKPEVKDETVAVTSVTLDKTALTFDKIGAADTLTATVNPSNATDKKVTWSTDNASVATVEDGKVTAVGNGTATITAKAGDKSASATVTVSQKSEKVIITLKGQQVKGTLKAAIKKSYTLKAVVTPETTDAKNAVVEWKSSNTKVAKVDKNGKVSIKKAGKTTITATTADGKKASVKFSASKKEVKVSKITITGSKTMKAKKKQTLKAVVAPATADNTKLTWTSSNKDVATVNKNGKVTAKKKGTAMITATAKDGSRKKAVFKIRVK